MADTDQADVQNESEQEVDSTTVETDDQSDDELEALLAEFRKEEKPKSSEPETKDDAPLEDRLRKIEERDKQRAKQENEKQLNDRLERTVDELIKANPDLKKITRSGVRGTLIGDLYQDADLFVAFSDTSNPAGYKKLVNGLAKRYAKELPADDPDERDDTRAVLSEVRGVSTRAPKKPDETEFVKTASREEFLNKYGSVMPGFIR